MTTIQAYEKLTPEDRATLESEAATWSTNLGREVSPLVCYVSAQVISLAESDEFPKVGGKSLALRTSLQHIVIAAELAIELEGKDAAAIASSIHAHVCVVAEGVARGAKGAKFSPKFR